MIARLGQVCGICTCGVCLVPQEAEHAKLEAADETQEAARLQPADVEDTSTAHAL